MMLINWKRFVVNLLPVKLRTGSVYGLISAMVSGVVHIYNTLLSYNNNVTYKLAHTSQVWSIEDVLNDSFDPSQRRIYLQDAGGEVVTLIHRRTDEEPVIIQPRTDPALLIHNRSAYDGGNFDFIVITPYRYTEADIYAMRALVNYYKLAGKRFDIIPAS